MSNKNIKRYRGFGPGYVIPEDMPNNMVGRLCTLIDALGLKESQEKSLKDLIKQEVYKPFSGVDPECVWIPGQFNNEIHYTVEDIQEEIRKNPSGSGETNSAVKGKLPWLDDYEYDVSFKLN